MSAREGVRLFLLFPSCAVGAFLAGYYLAPILKAMGIQP